MSEHLADEQPWWRTRRFQQIGTNVFVVGWIVYCVAMATHGGWVAVAGGCGVLAALALWWTQFGPRTGGTYEPSADENGDGDAAGTVLPRRPGNTTGSLVVCFLHPVTAAVFGASIVTSDDGGNAWAWGLLLTAPIPLVAGIGVAAGWARGRGRMRLTPAGFAYLPIWTRRPVTATWTSITSATTDGSVGNGVFVMTNTDRVPIWTGGVGVPPEALVALLNWYAGHAADRAETEHPDSVAARVRSFDAPPVMSS